MQFLYGNIHSRELFFGTNLSKLKIGLLRPMVSLRLMLSAAFFILRNAECTSFYKYVNVDVNKRIYVAPNYTKNIGALQ